MTQAESFHDYDPQELAVFIKQHNGTVGSRKDALKLADYIISLIQRQEYRVIVRWWDNKEKALYPTTELAKARAAYKLAAQLGRNPRIEVRTIGDWRLYQCPKA